MTRAWLKQLRAERSLTQAALATAAGIKPARYSRIEAGYCDLRDEEAGALAKTLKTTVEFIQNGSSKPESKGSVADTAKVRVEPAVGSIETMKTPATPVVVPKGLAVAHTNESLQPSAKGDDLADPKNFTLMPPMEVIAGGVQPSADFKHRLQQHIIFAEKVLHTSKVSPRVWVAWRDFNKEAQNLLRKGAPAPNTPSVEQKPSPIPSAVAPAPVVPSRPSPAKSTERTTRGNKNIFGYFLEVAEESLPPEKFNSLSTKAADAKKQQPELGFMKHFKRIAEAELPPTDFSKIAAEAAQRFSS